MTGLVHDHAWAIATSVVEAFASLLREEEKRDAFEAVYERVRAGIEHYESKADRIERRLRPSKN